MESNNQNRVKIKDIQDKIWVRIFQIVTFICASIIIMIVAFILYKGIAPFFTEYVFDGETYRVDLFKFLVGTEWHIYPNIYSIGYIILNTLYITMLSLVLAVPTAIFTALFITKIAPKYVGKTLNSVIELLASIPSIIYGIFGLGYLTQVTKFIASIFNVQTAGGSSTLTVVLVLSIMIYPTITMISITSINAVPKQIINGSLALGVSNTQTNFKVVLKTAKNGIFAGVILGVGRALGEATAISMVSGNAIKGPNFSLFDITNTLTTTILNGFNNRVGLDYDIRFSVALVLIIIIIVVNIILSAIKNRIGEIK